MIQPKLHHHCHFTPFVLSDYDLCGSGTHSRLLQNYRFVLLQRGSQPNHEGAATLPTPITTPYTQCSCQSANGFGLFQQDTDVSGSSSFHTILDIVCRNCTQKVPNFIFIVLMDFYNNCSFPDKLWHLHNS